MGLFRIFDIKHMQEKREMERQKHINHEQYTRVTKDTVYLRGLM